VGSWRTGADRRFLPRRRAAGYGVVARFRDLNRSVPRSHRPIITGIATGALMPPIGSLLTGPERSRTAARRTTAYRVVAHVRDSHRPARRPHRHITAAAVRPPIGSLLTGPDRRPPAARRTTAYRVVAHGRDSQHPARRPHRHITTTVGPYIGSLLTGPDYRPPAAHRSTAYRVVAHVRVPHRPTRRPHRHVIIATAGPHIGSLLTAPDRRPPAAHPSTAYRVVAHCCVPQHPARRPHRSITTTVGPPIGSLLTGPDRRPPAVHPTTAYRVVAHCRVPRRPPPHQRHPPRHQRLSDPRLPRRQHRRLRLGQQPGPFDECAVVPAQRPLGRAMPAVPGGRGNQLREPLRRPRAGAGPAMHPAPPVCHRQPEAAWARARPRPAAPRQRRAAGQIVGPRQIGLAATDARAA
jgi:hypothetical protein